MITPDEARRLALDDELSAHPVGQTVVIGCGNLLRGDDAVGPTLIRHLWEQGVPDGVTLVDGGTAGMDVAFKMRGARSVVLIDASDTGVAPGTIYRVPGEEVEDLPPLEGLHSHQFRWDHALAFARWLLAGSYPEDITVYLIEIDSTEPGAPLTPVVEAAMHEVVTLVRGHWEGGGFGPVGTEEAGCVVEFTADGDLRLSAEVAARYFPADSLVAVRRDDEGPELWLMPLVGPEGGGLLLKQRNPRGDRSTLVWESLPPDRSVVGERTAVWDDDHHALRVDVGPDERFDVGPDERFDVGPDERFDAR